MTYNVLDGGEGREEYLSEVLQTVQPDVAVLQEVFHESFIQNLASALEMASFFPCGNRKRRVALLSRLPVISCQSHHPFPPIWRNVVEAEIEYQQPNSRLNNILVNGALKPHLINCWVVREPPAILKASDHYPVVAEFQL